jgi:hypothetical protein
MTVGTKSVLFGAHQFILHPLFVALAWWRLYGPPLDPRLWVAFAVHDLGYWGKPDMDGPEGEKHTELGARIMGKLFGCRWALFTVLHSRYQAKLINLPPSRLCIADKFAYAIEPWWLYLPRVIVTGEIHEYMRKSARMSRREPMTLIEGARCRSSNARAWHRGGTAYTRRWVMAHKKDNTLDTWTSLDVRDT